MKVSALLDQTAPEAARSVKSWWVRNSISPILVCLLIIALMFGALHGILKVRQKTWQHEASLEEIHSRVLYDRGVAAGINGVLRFASFSNGTLSVPLEKVLGYADTNYTSGRPISNPGRN